MIAVIIYYLIILGLIILAIYLIRKYINKLKQEEMEFYSTYYREDTNMYCSKCGTQIENGVCPKCGAVNQEINGQSMPNGIPQGNPYSMPYGNTYYGMPGRFNISGIIPKNAAGWIGILKFMCWIKCIIAVIVGGSVGAFFDSMIYRSGETYWILGIICGIVIGISLVAKDMIYANIAENVGIIGKNIANVDK